MKKFIVMLIFSLLFSNKNITKEVISINQNSNVEIYSALF